LSNLLYATNAILIQNIDNNGYGGGINFGAKFASKFDPEYIHIINTDTHILNKNYFEEIVSLFSNNKSYGVIGPGVLKTDGQIQNTIMPFVSLKSALLFKFIAINKSTIESRPKLFSVDVVNGVCFIINYKAFEKVNGFDDAFFMYGEEQDFCFRLNKAGFQVGFWSGLGIQHFESHNQQSNKVLGWRDILTRCNIVLFAKKHINNILALIIALLFSVSFLIKAIRGYRFIDYNLLKTIGFMFSPKSLNNYLKMK